MSETPTMDEAVEELRDLCTRISGALKQKMDPIAYTFTDLNALLLRKTGKQFEPNSTGEFWYSYLVDNGYLHTNGTAPTYFFFIPGGLQDTYNRDLGAGIYSIGNYTDPSRGVLQGDLTLQTLYDTLNRPYFKLTNTSSYRLIYQMLDCFKYDSDGKYFRKQNSSGILYPNNYEISWYFVHTFDIGYTVDDFKFFSNDVRNEPINAQDFSSIIRSL